MPHEESGETLADSYRMGLTLLLARAVLRRDRAEDQRGLQDERLTRARGIPADDFADPLEAVANSVGVHEQFPGRRLERSPVVEVAPQGVEQFARVVLQRREDPVDQGGASE